MDGTEELLLSFFPFSPTGEQKMLFKELARFLDKKSSKPSVFLLTGYAGTGKTICLKALYHTADEMGHKVVFLAPTGRAAKIISKNTKRKAHTLHRHIYQQSWNPLNNTFEFKLRKNYRNNCLFVVDEASMISNSENSKEGNNLLSDLIQFVFENKYNKLVLVGDPAQLPPVGNPLSLALNQEILQYAYQLDVVACQLSQVSRQHKDSGILSNATALRETLNDPAKKFSFCSHPTKDTFLLPKEKLFDGLAYSYEKYGINNTLLLCSTNQEAFSYNQDIREHILKKRQTVERGDLLMVSRNNYQVLPGQRNQGFLANGEFTEVVDVLCEEKFGSFEFINLNIRLPDYPKQPPFICKILKETLLSAEATLEAERSQELFRQVLNKYRVIRSPGKQTKAIRQDPYLNALHVKYAYALTCHKAQGGQWDAAFVQEGFWKRKPSCTEKTRWLYTALTRAIHELYLIG